MNGDNSALVGAWKILLRLSAGEDDREPDDDDKFLWFGDTAVTSGDEWAAWDTPYTVAGGPLDGEIDVERTDMPEPWIQLGIFRVQGSSLELCMGDEPGARPEAFESTVANANTYYRLERCDEPLPG